MPETMRCLSPKLAVLPPSHWQQHAVWVCFSGAVCPLAWVLEELDPRFWSPSEAWTGQTEGWCWGTGAPRGQQRDMRLRYCSTSGTRH